MSRAGFEEALIRLFEPTGLRPVPGPRDISDGALYWLPYEDLVLQVAVVFHRFYEQTYTFDFWLGRTFTFGLAAPGYPRFASGRFTRFAPRSAPADGFFIGYSAEAAEIAAGAVDTALVRYKAQPGLADAVREVPLLSAIRDVDLAIIQGVADASAVDPERLRLQPTGRKASLPAAWYVAAEVALVAHEAALGFPVNANHVRSYALDAWRCAETSVLRKS